MNLLASAIPTLLLATIAVPAAVAAQERKSVAPKAMQDVAPGLAEYTDDVLFGDVWVRPQLSPRDRSLVTLSVLLSTGKSAQMTSHVNIALTNGLAPSAISGLATHLAFYSGWPNAVSALAVIDEVFVARKVDLAALRKATMVPRAPSLTVTREPNPTMATLAPKFEQLTSEVIYDDLWRRTDLVPRDRSLVTIAALAANGDEAQLASHIRRGLANGLARADLMEALTHLAFYAGWPRANSAIRLAGTILGSSGAASSATSPRLTVTPAGADPAAGPSENFTGRVTVTSRFKGSGDARLGGATVAFSPGAHTNWHSHPLGQLLIVTEGRGWVQAEGEPVREVRAGEVVWTAPGVRHWHGATRSSAMTHTAVAEAVDGETVTWMEPVTDAQYRGPR